MKAASRIQRPGRFERLFGTVSDIACWPEFLPHYRWVKILSATPHPAPIPDPDSRYPTEVIAEMAARHMGIPLWWRTILRPRPQERRIYFTHIGGITQTGEGYLALTPT